MTGPEANARRYRVTHQTRYDYGDVVTNSYGRCHLQPRALPGQRVLDAQVTIDPHPDDVSTGIDIYGNTDNYFQVRTPHRRLEVIGTSTVEVDPVDQQLLTSSSARAPWEFARPSGRSGARAVEYQLDLYPPEITASVRDYASKVFVPQRPLIETIVDLNGRIFEDFTYRSGSTEISTKVDRVLEYREGVCQDFARVAIACLRSQGLAARYVSGYLATDPPPGAERVFGADASHAWAAVWLPGDRWIAFDPTNNVLVGERHITVAWGRDYADVPPLRGVIFSESTNSKIDVSVDVTPVSTPQVNA
ncbi:hypothetical protein GOEFS_050_00300 [Gordonia effusa NBRC 100432]|uniref:Transglutaminase-like domain-containing protein n=1 Tax=Gordonia effusa NBRC 100432 TaxID=1077974 RepID=H0QZK1_9ACTN|nr:transglutaminase family protein [Gordonia effusa]GAB18252.1 hypothetical protein GOEFS_050_00300 [Gordonia effusa NBRC 100432]